MKNGDKRGRKLEFPPCIPGLANFRAQFPKTSHRCKLLTIQAIYQLSTFHAQTITTTSNSLLKTLLLRSRPSRAMVRPSHTASPGLPHCPHTGAVSHNKTCRAEGSLQPRIKLSHRHNLYGMAWPDRFGVQFGQQPICMSRLRANASDGEKTL